MNIQHRKTYLPIISLHSECLKSPHQKGPGWRSFVNKITPLNPEKRVTKSTDHPQTISQGQKSDCNLWGYMYLPQDTLKSLVECYP